MDIWDLFEQAEIDSAAWSNDIARRDASHPADRLHGEVLRLEAKIDGLALVCQALWELLRQETGLKDADIAKKMAEVDLRDGKRDGRIMGKAVNCAKCARPTPARQRTCVFCGAPVEQGHVVEKTPNR
jgi:hypothetical protein